MVVRFALAHWRCVWASYMGWCDVRLHLHVSWASTLAHAHHADSHVMQVVGIHRIGYVDSHVLALLGIHACPSWERVVVVHVCASWSPITRLKLGSHTY